MPSLEARGASRAPRTRPPRQALARAPSRTAPQKSAHVVHVLERVSAENHRDAARNVLGREERPFDGHAVGRGPVQTIFAEARVDGVSGSAREGADLEQKVGPTGADLEDVAPLEGMPLDERPSQLGGVLAEARRERLHLFVARRVVMAGSIERGIREQSAVAANDETQIRSRVRHRIRLRIEQRRRVDGNSHAVRAPA